MTPARLAEIRAVLSERYIDPVVNGFAEELLAEVDRLAAEVDRLRAAVDNLSGVLVATRTEREKFLIQRDQAIERACQLKDKVDAFQTASGLCVPAEERGGDPGGVEPIHVEDHIQTLSARVTELEEALSAAQAENRRLAERGGAE